MKRVLVKSVHGAFSYVMERYYPFGMAAEAAEPLSINKPMKLLQLHGLCYVLTVILRYRGKVHAAR